MKSKSILIFLLLFFSFNMAYAEKIGGYIPPPFSHRLLCSFIVLTPLSILTFLFTYLYFKFIDKAVDKIKILKLFSAMLISLILICLMAASDEINDEGWSPISQAPLITIYIPFVIPILGEKLKRSTKIIIGIGMFLVLTWVIGSAELNYYDLIRKTNLPTSW